MKSKKLLKKVKHWRFTHCRKLADFSLEEKKKRFFEHRQYNGRSRQWLKAWNMIMWKEVETYEEE